MHPCDSCWTRPKTDLSKCIYIGLRCILQSTHWIIWKACGWAWTCICVYVSARMSVNHITCKKNTDTHICMPEHFPAGCRRSSWRLKSLLGEKKSQEVYLFNSLWHIYSGLPSSSPSPLLPHSTWADVLSLFCPVWVLKLIVMLQLIGALNKVCPKQSVNCQWFSC